MPRAWPVHLLAMLVQVGVTAYGIWVLGPALPDAVRTLLFSLLAALVVVWWGLIFAWAAARKLGRGFSWRRTNWVISWLGNAANIAGFWIVAPYSPDALILLLAAFAYANVTVQVLSSIQRPPASEGWVLTPLAIPISLALYAATHFDRYLAALMALAQIWAQKGGVDPVIELCDKALVASPFHEDAAAMKIEALARAGRMGEAEAAYQAHAKALEAELDEEPGKRVSDVYKVLVQQAR